MQQASSASPRPPMPAFHQLDGVAGEAGPPLIGHTLEFVRNTTGLVDRLSKAHGADFKLRMFGQPLFLVGDPDSVRAVLLDREKKFSSKWGWDHAIGELFSRGLMLRDFDNHRSHRRIMQSAFRADAMRTYLDMMNPLIERGIAPWEQASKFRFYPAIKQLTLDLAAEVFMGVPLGPEADRVNQAFVDSVQASIAVIKKDLPLTSYRRGMNGRRFLERFFADRVAEKRRGNGRDMFSEFCRATSAAGESFGDRAIGDHMIFLLMAAHDTTTSSLSSMIYRLAADTGWQDRLREEVLAHDGSHLLYEEKDQFPQLDMAFKEALRMHPPVPFIARRALRDVEIGDVTLPAGTPISVCSLVTHNLESVWTRPEHFDPDRFGPDRAEDKAHSHAYFPFGGGAHTCIGMHFAYLQVKAFLFQFLRRYKFRLVPGHSVTMIPIPIPRPKEGLALKIERLA